jgi:CBS domain-containing protein
MKSTVKELLEEKGSNVWTINQDETVYNGLVMMAKKDVGALLVVDQEGKLVGMFSERDYARKIVLFGKSSKDTKIGDMMSTEISVVRPEDTIQNCLSLMTKKKVRHLPVIYQNELLGIVSIGDAVNRVISDQEETIHNLEDYIYGRAYGARIDL